MKNRMAAGHVSAFVTIVIWGTTFISTKILLEDFKPMEILFFRFLLGFLVLTVACPKRLKCNSFKQKLTFVAAGFTGICLYYLLENVALTYTMASNVGVILSIAPFFTSILSRIFLKGAEKPKVHFYIGFLIAIAGICLINFNGAEMQLNLLGDLLSVAAAIVWAGYSVLSKKISSFGWSTILTTRRTFAYGLLCMMPLLFFGDFHVHMGRFGNPANLWNMLFLGIGASALCFVTWNTAVKTLDAVKTSIYIYLVPVITLAFSSLILGEKITVLSAAGMALTLLGLLFSEYNGKQLKRHLCMFQKKNRRRTKMNLENKKSVMVVDERLPLGVAANTAAILGITMGMKQPDIVGGDVYDAEGNVHAGIIQFPIPILRGNENILKSLRERLYRPEFADLTVVDFSDLAQGCRTYDEYIEKMSKCQETALQYRGIAIYGDKRKINQLTGRLPLLKKL